MELGASLCQSVQDLSCKTEDTLRNFACHTAILTNIDSIVFNKRTQTTNLLYSTLNLFIVFFGILQKVCDLSATEKLQCKREES